MPTLEDVVRRRMDVRQDTGDEWLILCPFHEDTTPSLYLNIRSGLWICHACQAKGGRDALFKRLGYTGVPVMDLDSVRRRQERLRAPVGVGGVRALPESALDAYSVFPTDYWTEERGLTQATVDRLQLGYDLASDSGTIPIRTNEGTLHGVIKRKLGAKAKLRYRYPKGLKIGSYLWGDWLVKGSEVAIVEGSLDVAALMDVGIEAVALLGSRMTRMQRKRLMELYPTKVVIYTDNDRAGREAVPDIVSALRGKCIIRQVQWDVTAKDASDLSVTDRVRLYEQAVGPRLPKRVRYSRPAR